jgi:hypothetical protein
MESGDRSSHHEADESTVPPAPTPADEPNRERQAENHPVTASARPHKLHRVIVVAPATDQAETYLATLFAEAGRAIPEALARWEDTIDDWCDRYREAFSDGSLLEINLTTAIYIFDRTHERVVVAYGLSTAPAQQRDTNRMRQFPDVNVGITNTMGDNAFAADRGHFLSHAAGGELDINLFPHRRELNQGRSPEGKEFRRMERYTATHPGTFHYHRAEYDDETWIPATLEYGVLRDGHQWWVGTFHNK